MILNNVKLILFFIHTFKQSICVNLNNITLTDIKTLQNEYPNIMRVMLKDHPYYIFSYNELKYCPVHFSHLVDCERVPYEGIEIKDSILEYVVDDCIRYKRYDLGYAIIVNAIESLGFTYMYQFCEFAIEMNKKGANISNFLKIFSKNLKSKIMPIFNKEWISPEPYECILNVYKEHKHKYENYEFNKVDEKYMSDLLICKNLMKDKVHFLSKPPEKSMNNMSEQNLISIQMNNNTIIQELLTIGSGPFKDITGYKYETSCLGDTDHHSGKIGKIHIFLPCGHGWSCENCIVLNEQCPVCHQQITGTQGIHIDTPASIVNNDQTLCTGCTTMRYSGTVSVIHIFLCGHGWSCGYCNVLNKQCPVCHQPITGTQVIHIETPASIVENGLVILQPRCVLDGREARCISCHSQIKDVNPPNKYVMRPCGHGWYCSKCIDSANCTKCRSEFKDKLCVKI
ncbi:uncharacterized protein LOC126897457 isoform X2 [Daktulosphaira vitifoliae]|uniref:uncharacterized protein LOC126897457 isoform X2 n=1 Tax=Daktulosphaira vitifoliae TaxID=58002 RepID=UPI0021A9D990|nr:uncharacterized protein LOC126897457 isoform X2 [Daktulosphaira vitifoliae]